MSKDKEPRKKEGVCRTCHENKVVIFAPDPYNSEISGDHKKVWMCQSCRDSRSEDI